MVAGDFNARVHGRVNELETMIGDHWFGRNIRPARDNPLVEANRNMFIEYAADTGQKIMNRMLPKQDKDLYTERLSARPIEQSSKRANDV